MKKKIRPLQISINLTVIIPQYSIYYYYYLFCDICVTHMVYLLLIFSFFKVVISKHFKLYRYQSIQFFTLDTF